MADKPSSHSTFKFRSLPEDGSVMNDVDNYLVLKRMMTTLLDSGIHSDATFLVENQTFKAHRAILAAQSPVFASMLLGKSFKEGNNQSGTVINVPDKRPETFEIFLRYLYICTPDVSGMELDDVLEVLFIAHEYQVEFIVTSIIKELLRVISMKTVFPIFETALVLEIKSLTAACRHFLYMNAEEALKNPGFYELSKEAVLDLLSSDKFYAQEIDILWAVRNWHEKNKCGDHDENLKELLKKVRFEHMSLDGMSMAKIAPLYELLAAHQIDVKMIGSSSESNTRPRLPIYARRNVATRHYATVEASGSTVVSADTFFKARQSAHSIGQLAPIIPIKLLPPKTSVVVNLKHVGFFVSMAFTVSSETPGAITSPIASPFSSPVSSPGLGNSGCGYKVETSCDKEKWVLLADCSSLGCKDQQQLLFKPRRFQYVRITDVRSRQGMAVSNFQCADESVALENIPAVLKRFENCNTLLRTMNNTKPRSQVVLKVNI